MLKLVAAVSLRCNDSDLAYDVDRHDRRALADLADLPERARVIVDVTGRRFVTQSARTELARQMNRLEIQLEGDVGTLRRWSDAILGSVDDDEGAA
jgi:hypothetical protein